MKQSVSLITLGVSDYERAKSFYEALGWSTALEVEQTAFFQANVLHDASTVQIAEPLDTTPSNAFDFGWNTWAASAWSWFDPSGLIPAGLDESHGVADQSRSEADSVRPGSSAGANSASESAA